MSSPSEISVRASHVRDMDPAVLYRLLRLRVDVFVVEQTCAYPELDGRELEEDAVLLWIEQDGELAATIRLLQDGLDARIGRVATSAAQRGQGLAATLMREAISRSSGQVIRLDAQSHLAHWYGGFGFQQDGPEFLEDGIPHVPMVYAQGS
ncbi:GNAT family N-acetyltransferase [Microbacterium amylolyticum]|uniref:ElaA protein n=1 Tax=Microbacterium amylolyticum TaxID=936337 RepID=A0ABS4ZFY7_9MICO|nr:GNAT family N-acetyltransferase [Microbacterium amylolyticum]MBP2436190.1 ElaA protein [Microbacterium amylolyticum]